MRLRFRPASMRIRANSGAGPTNFGLVLTSFGFGQVWQCPTMCCKPAFLYDFVCCPLVKVGHLAGAAWLTSWRLKAGVSGEWANIGHLMAHAPRPRMYYTGQSSFRNESFGCRLVFPKSRAQVCGTSVEPGRNSAEMRPRQVDICRNRHTVGPKWAIFRPDSVGVAPMWTDIGRKSAAADQIWPRLNVDRLRPKIWPTSTIRSRFWVDAWSTPGRVDHAEGCRPRCGRRRSLPPPEDS